MKLFSSIRERLENNGKGKNDLSRAMNNACLQDHAPTDVATLLKCVDLLENALCRIEMGTGETSWTDKLIAEKVLAAVRALSEQGEGK